MSEIRQVGINPDVFESPERQCVGGPCDGQRMHIAPGHVLVVARDRGGDNVRAVSGSREFIPASIQCGTYAGHYELDTDETLKWVAP